MSAIVFGSEEARGVLWSDFQRRTGATEICGVGDPSGEIIPPPLLYIPGDWRDADPPLEDGEEDWLDEPGELSGGNIVRSGWGRVGRGQIIPTRQQFIAQLKLTAMGRVMPTAGDFDRAKPALWLPMTELLRHFDATWAELADEAGLKARAVAA